MTYRALSVLALGSLSCLFVFAPGCSSDDGGGDDKPKPDAGSDADAAGPKLPGSACTVNAECEGNAAHAGVCLHGVCVTRATAPCPAPASPDGCDPGALCFNSTVVGGNGFCLPKIDAAACSGGAINRHEVCAPIKGKGCDAAAGTFCELFAPPAGEPGAKCADDTECTTTDAKCYQGSGKISAWLEGYCLSFGCQDSSVCGQGSCQPVAADGSGVCIQGCGMDLDCRVGYWCSKTEDGTGNYCRAGCDAAAVCPAGLVCMGSTGCVPDDVGCSPKKPDGWCPKDSWCDQGKCSKEVFSCGGKDDPQEDNDSQATAKPAPAGVTEGLVTCKGDDDWWSVTVPKGKVLRVGIEFANAAGDLDLVVYDAAGKIVGSRTGDSYPYSDRTAETDTEYYGLWSEAGGDKYFVRVTGYMGSENKYSLHVDEYAYQDGKDCESVFSAAQCIGQAAGGTGLIPFPFPDTKSGKGEDNYLWDTYSNYRFARRELVMLVRWALAETGKAFPGTKPLGLIDTCQIDGITPGYDVDDPRHPESTHDQGGNQDLAYFQTGADNSARIVCGDGSTHADGFCSDAAKTKHIVDLPRQAFFMAKLNSSPRARVIGADQVLAPLIIQAGKDLGALPDGDPKKLTAAEVSGLAGHIASGSGWPYHHHHIHLSLKWWGQENAYWYSQFQDDRSTSPAQLVTAWPARGERQRPTRAPRKPH